MANEHANRRWTITSQLQGDMDGSDKLIMELENKLQQVRGDGAMAEQFIHELEDVNSQYLKRIEQVRGRFGEYRSSA